MRKSRGFSLIEMIIAIVILTISIGTLLWVSGDVFRLATTPEILDASSQLAERELERVLTLRFSDVANEGPTNYTGSFAGYSYQITVSAVPGTIATDPAMANYKQVQVSITHTTAGTVSLRTIVTNT